jgi:hypothetical protein
MANYNTPERAIGLSASWTPLNGVVTTILPAGVFQVILVQNSKANPTGVVISDSAGNTSNTFLAEGEYRFNVGASQGNATTVTVTPQAGGNGIKHLMMTALNDGIGQNSPPEVFASGF